MRLIRHLVDSVAKKVVIGLVKRYDLPPAASFPLTGAGETFHFLHGSKNKRLRPPHQKKKKKCNVSRADSPLSLGSLGLSLGKEKKSKVL